MRKLKPAKKKPDREFSSGGIVVRKSGRSFSVLLIKDCYGRWTWPKGHIDKGESADSAAKREIREEVGIKKVAVIEKVGKTEYFFKLKGRLIFKTVYLYLCSTDQAGLTIQESEIRGAEWLTPEAALKRVEYRGARSLLSKALKRYSAISKTHLYIVAMVVALFSLSNPQSAPADTVFFRDGSELKGIVVDNYADRITYSTIDGEREILKSDIHSIKHDEAVDNLINLGDLKFDNRDYISALKYYTMAKKISPFIPGLGEKIYHTETRIQREPDEEERLNMELKNELMAGGPVDSRGESEADAISGEEALWDKYGIRLMMNENGRYLIERIAGRSPFKKSGVKRGDGLVAIWSRLCDYLPRHELADLLVKNHGAFISITIERNIALPKEATFDAEIALEWEGAVVSKIKDKSSARLAGFRANDNIVQINDTSLRYTKLGEIRKMIKDTSLRRAVTIRRKFDIAELF